MATSSADPDDLGIYVTDATAARTTLSTAAAGVRAYYHEVVARFGAQYSLSHPDLWAKLDTHLADAEERDRFVGTVKDAFVAADRGSAGTAAGTVTVDDSRIAAGLAVAGIGSLPTASLTVDAPELLARTPDSGFAADPVCTATGNLVEQEIDLPLPGRVGPAGWRRTYNSRAHDRPGAPGVDRPTQLPLLGATLHADGAGFRFTRGPGETWWYDEAGQPPSAGSASSSGRPAGASPPSLPRWPAVRPTAMTGPVAGCGPAARPGHALSTAATTPAG